MSIIRVVSPFGWKVILGTVTAAVLVSILASILA